MKKVLLLGKFNITFQEINAELEKSFSVQACVDNADMAKGLLKLNSPDVVVMCLWEMGDVAKKVLDEIRYNYVRMPVVCLGTEDDKADYTAYMRLIKMEYVTAPITVEKTLVAISQVLNMTYDAQAGTCIDNKSEKKTVLLVDDNAMQLRTLNTMLKEQYDVQMATSGMKALTMIGKKLPDVILLDYEMPMCDGKMTMEMIREVEEAKDIPIVFLTGVNDKEHIETVLRLRPAGYLLKPANAEKIYATLEEVLKKDKMDN
ncbi:MAG: response regulator [Lachnospira sp.]|nr:response regulator [Lachnospira sp.]